MAVGFFIPEGLLNFPVGELPSGKFQSTKPVHSFPADKNTEKSQTRPDHYFPVSKNPQENFKQPTKKKYFIPAKTDTLLFFSSNVLIHRPGNTFSKEYALISKKKEYAQI